MNIKKIVIAMSGGVDSSVSAWLLKKKGFHVEGVFMKNWENNDNLSNCSFQQDLKDAKSVCNKIGIYLHTINFSFEYWNTVFKKFIKKYKKGSTPNPDIWCNKEIKFNIFLNFACNILKADYIATGHYAQIKKNHKNYYLFRGLDSKKDQSYFLYTLKQSNMSKIFFPLACIKKQKVRKIAKKLNLCVAKKKDSNGICFIPPKKFNIFLNDFIPKKKGKILTMSGEFLGYHFGVPYYTIGQRKGLYIGGKKNKIAFSWYVVKKNIITNIIFVVQGKGNPYLLSFGFIAHHVHWINNIKNKIFFCFVQIRHRLKPIKCKVIKKNKKKIIQVFFEKPSFFVTPGQAAVFYKFNNCLGGSEIKTIIPFLT